MNVINTTGTDEQKQSAADKAHDDEVRRMAREFKDAPCMDIQLQKLEGENQDQTVEGGINGYFFTLHRGKRIQNCPMPIIETLQNAGIEFSQLSEVRRPATVKAAGGRRRAASGEDKEGEDKDE